MATTDSTIERTRFMRGGRWLALPITLGLAPLTAILATLIQSSFTEKEINAVLLPVLLMWWPGVITAIFWWRHPHARGDLAWHAVKAFGVLGCAIIATGISFLILSIMAS